MGVQLEQAMKQNQAKLAPVVTKLGHKAWPTGRYSIVQIECFAESQQQRCVNDLAPQQNIHYAEA